MKQHTRKQENPAQVRYFTRKDVEDCFHRIWGAAFRLPGDIVTIKDIALVSGLTPATWRVEYCVDTASTGFHYHDAVLLSQSSRTTLLGRQEFYLTVPPEHSLPEGCASVKEEERRLRQQRCARAVPEEERS